ncbi:GNAT family N-acetyltransferase [Demequina sediminis]|uniref:GNAT family N-acetyltransferase n=1 Tax=Demequina sediminis TaxID=1930058 RepID=UPI0031E84BE2|nr:N-acetyltransferase GCN5 [Demequina sediminis]
MTSYTTPVHLGVRHDVSEFRCESEELSTWLRVHARSSHGGGHTRVAVVTEHGSDRVVGYSAIAPGHVLAEDATARMRAGGGRHPVPVVVLARLAVDARHTGKGLGGGLLLDAIMRSLAAAEEIGGRALVVDAKDQAAKEFYLRQLSGFQELPGDPMRLVLMFKDIRATIAEL